MNSNLLKLAETKLLKGNFEEAQQLARTYLTHVKKPNEKELCDVAYVFGTWWLI